MTVTVKSPRRRFAVLLTWLAALILAQFTTAALVRLFRRDQCPAGSFLSRISLDTLVLMGIPLAIVLVGVAALVTNSVPAVFGGKRQNLLIAVIAAAAVFLGGLYVGLGNELCLSWRSIVIRDNSLSPVRSYAWTDVVELHAVCATHGLVRRRHQTTGAHFFLAGDKQFWLSADEYSHAFAALGRVLRDVKYRFDHSDIDETCSQKNLALFSKSP